MIDDDDAAPTGQPLAPFKVKQFRTGLSGIWKSDSVSELLEMLEGPESR